MPFPKMNTSVSEAVHIEKWTEDERIAILEEANRILADRTFKNSKRCQALFGNLVDRALAEGHDAVKERILGVEVFGRDPNYDTSADPIVRIAANETRKRLGQWYQEPDRRHLVRISLHPGSYHLDFDFAHRSVLPEEEELKPLEQPVVRATFERLDSKSQEPAPPALVAPTRTKRISAIIIALLLCLAAVFLARHSEIVRSKQYVAWKPLLDSGRPVIICVPDGYPLGSTNRQTSGQTIADWQAVADMIATRQVPASVQKGTSPNTPSADAEVAQKIAAWLGTHAGQTSPRSSSDINLQEFRQEPAVLIGGFNPWSLVLLSNLRYTMRVDPASRSKWIQDAQNPSNRNWIYDGTIHESAVDYAIITRVLDPETGSWIVSLGGLRQYGTQMAGDLLTDNSYVRLLPSGLKPTGNFQIVLKTSVINGSAGHPEFLAYYAW